MNDAALFEATVPVFRHYLRRIDALLLEVSPAREPLLQRTLVAGAFSAAEHLDTALGFVPRTVLPLLGRDVPDSEERRVLDRRGLVDLSGRVHALLEGLDAREFVGAASRLVRHAAGEADLEQDATTFVTLFALPNFFFHLGMAFAILRKEGVDIGKGDFDGQHVYPAGFRFEPLTSGESE